MAMMTDVGGRDGNLGYGGGGVARPRVTTPPPPPTPPPPIPPPTWTAPKPPTTGGPLPPTPVTPAPGTNVATLQTGGPLPPTKVTQAVTYPGQQPLTTNKQVVPAGPAAVPAQANASPISIMDWRARLAQGDEQATTRGVGANETVAYHMDQLADSGSAYINNAQDRAREEASARGMMMSSTAAGAGARAAIDASLPIAQQDAQTYGRTASENMAARNADSLQDQSMFGQLTGQELGIKANLDESERARGFSALENQRNRQFTERSNVMQQNWQAGQNTQQQNWQTAQNNAQLQQQLRQQEIQVAHDAAMQTLNRNTQLTMQDKQYLQERFNQYQTAMNNQSALLSQAIASIYNNPNLSAQQQAAAVANAQAVYKSIFQSYASAMSGGLPQIFYQPYAMKK